VTKVSAARQAAEHGTAVVLTATSLVAQALRGERVGTWFAPAPAEPLPTGSVTAVTSDAAAS
jgi:glutamate 5-kinase